MYRGILQRRLYHVYARKSLVVLIQSLIVQRATHAFSCICKLLIYNLHFVQDFHLLRFSDRFFGFLIKYTCTHCTRWLPRCLSLQQLRSPRPVRAPPAAWVEAVWVEVAPVLLKEVAKEECNKMTVRVEVCVVFLFSYAVFQIFVSLIKALSSFGYN